MASKASDVNSRPADVVAQATGQTETQEGPGNGCQRGIPAGPGTGQEHSAGGPQPRRPGVCTCPLGWGKVKERGR